MHVDYLRTCGSPVNEEAEGEMESTKMMNPPGAWDAREGLILMVFPRAEMVRVNR